MTKLGRIGTGIWIAERINEDRRDQILCNILTQQKECNNKLFINIIHQY